MRVLAKRNTKANERIFEHYARLESKSDEMIALLKEIRDRLDKPRP
jgi:hypothetical protein